MLSQVGHDPEPENIQNTRKKHKNNSSNLNFLADRRYSTAKIRYFNIPSIKTPENKDNSISRIDNTFIEQTYEKSNSSCCHPVCAPPDDPGPQGEQAEHDDDHADAPTKHPVVPDNI